MRVLLQRVSAASVTIEGVRVAEIEQGLLLLTGIAQHDDADITQKMARKVAGLRIFEDAAGKMNKNLLSVGGAALVVSQFTLYADCTGGRRPFFGNGAKPDHAAPLIAQFIKDLGDLKIPVKQGEFAATMAVSLINDGPITIMLDSDQLF